MKTKFTVLTLILAVMCASCESYEEPFDLVQFEYGRVNVVNRFFLRDFYDFFEARGYAVGKIFPTSVDFRDYELSDEDFMGPNYLACRRDKPEYLRALAGSD